MGFWMGKWWKTMEKQRKGCKNHGKTMEKTEGKDMLQILLHIPIYATAVGSVCMKSPQLVVIWWYHHCTIVDQAYHFSHHAHIPSSASILIPLNPIESHNITAKVHLYHRWIIQFHEKNTCIYEMKCHDFMEYHRDLLNLMEHHLLKWNTCRDSKNT